MSENEIGLEYEKEVSVPELLLKVATLERQNIERIIALEKRIKVLEEATLQMDEGKLAGIGS